MRLIRNDGFLTNRHHFTPSHPEYRSVILLNVVLLAMIPISVFCAFSNLFFFQNATLAAVNLLVILFACGLLCYFHKTNQFIKASHLTVLLLLFSLSLYIVFNGTANYALYWICCFPPYLYFQLGLKVGRRLTLIYGSGLLIYLLSRHELWQPAGMNWSAIGNLFFATLMLILIIDYFEQSRNEVSAFVREKNRELNLTNEALQNSQEQLRLILDSTAEAIYGIDLQENCTFCNQSCLALLGYQREEDLLGKNMHSQILHNLQDGKVCPPEECRIIASLQEASTLHVKEEVFWRADASSFDAEYHSYPQYKDGKVTGAVITFMDITERKKDEDRIRFLSYHDSLTGLLNKSRFYEQVAAMDTEQNLPISLLFGDINGLKLINDIFGHSLGDQLIQKSAEILQKTCGDSAIIARAGGDEFILLLAKTDAAAAEKITDKITAELFKEKVSGIPCSMSMGFDTKTDCSQDIERTILNAESNMYQNKTSNRKQIDSGILNTVISTLHNKHPRERQHSLNTGRLCSQIGAALQLPETRIKKLGQAGYLHDIGKIVLKDEMLRTDTMTKEKRAERQKHPIMGYRILNLFDETLDLAESVYSHHENWDGSGYPKGLHGLEIPEMSRIIAVAEAYDAMTNIYCSNPLSNEEALLKMSEMAGKVIDPNITAVFIALMSKKPETA
ncbi:MAG: diguanylate cyclase [Negativicutes bacterium]|nr:diguanylate cyclase [Negativicutes bacterium]